MKTEDDIIELIKLSNKISINEIAKIIDVRRETISRLVNRLVKENKLIIEQVREGRKFISYVSISSEKANINETGVVVAKDHSEPEKDHSEIHCDQIEKIKELLKEECWNNVSLEDYIGNRINVLKPMEIENGLCGLFPQLSEHDRKLVLSFFYNNNIRNWFKLSEILHSID